MNRRRALSLLAAATSLGLYACAKGDSGSAEVRPPGKLRLVFKHQPLWGDPEPFRRLLADFERQNPDVSIATEPLPNASDVVHQYFLTALEGGARDFDVFVMDVIWVPEFARAGWIADSSSSAFPAEALRRDFLPGASEAVLVGGKAFAVPWYVDVGVFYYRSDLVPRPPRSYDELEAMAAEAQRKVPGLFGYVWQARQYEGLVCNVYEALWGHGGATMDGDHVLLDSPEAREALAYLRRLLERGLSPASVTSQAEEESRRVFQEGRAVFMRNWPYAWAEAQRGDSPIKGKVGLAALPTKTGETGYGALGGYQLALNAHSPAYKREAALRLIGHLTSDEANLLLATVYGRNPPRRAPYHDERLVRGAPFIANLLPMVERARPRPVTPYYTMISDALQGEFSAAVSGIRPPADALRRAQALVDHITRAGS